MSRFFISCGKDGVTVETTIPPTGEPFPPSGARDTFVYVRRSAQRVKNVRQPYAAGRFYSVDGSQSTGSVQPKGSAILPHWIPVRVS